MKRNLGFRAAVIVLVIGFLGWKAYQGVAGGRLELGIDLKGGSELIFRLQFEDDKESASKRELLTKAIGVIQDRIDGFGLKDIVLQPIGDDRFAIQVSARDKEKVDSIKGLVTDLGLLEFRITVESQATDNYEKYWQMFQDAQAKGIVREQARTIAPNDVIQEEKARFPYGLRWYELSQKTKQRGFGEDRLGKDENGAPRPWVLCELDPYEITGEDLFNVFHARPQGGLGSGWAVYFSVKKLAQTDMARLTEFEDDKYMAIILNNEVSSAPILKDTLSSQGQISGSFTEEEARSLAAILQAGALEQKPELISERTIAPELAGSARESGVLSTVLGFVFVLFIMAYLYLAPGLLANLALLLNLVIMLGVLTWFEAVLTLPGIAGVVLTVGMAVDANILVFERIKEERARGRTVAQAISIGYDRALVTIIDANVTTLITAYFLFQVGSGPVRGFGITLAVGIIASMFTALYVTRTIFEWMLRKGSVKEARMRGGFEVPAIGWMGMQGKAVLCSAVAMIAGITLWEVVPDKVKYDLDFTKGSKLIVRFDEPQGIDDVRATLDALGKDNKLFAGVAVRSSAEGIGATVKQGQGRGFELRSQNVATEDEIDAFKAKLRETFTGRLVAGPLEATITEAPGGGSAGRLFFVRAGVSAAVVKAAFEQHWRDHRALDSADVRPADTAEGAVPAPGAGSVFTFTCRDSAEDPGRVALNVRNALANFDLATALTHYEGVSTSETSTRTEQDAAKAMLEALRGVDAAQLGEPGTPAREAFLEECDPFPLADRIDPTTAQEHRDAAIQAVALSILGIIIYVAFRFRSWSMGFAAVMALIHDVLVTLGVVALGNWLGIVDARLNLVTVAAFLTLIGYSINDTIVVFDRIRENRGTGRARIAEIIDKSVNQTLSRTLRTTATTWVVVVILLVMNYGANSALEGFAFILTFGALVGTYSTIFIASPTLVFLPHLWEQCGSSVKTLLKHATPWMAVALLIILAVDIAEERITFDHDVSREIFNNVLLAIPVGVLAMFLWRFLRFVRSPALEAPAAAQ